MVTKMDDRVKERGIKVNISKTNVMVFEIGESLNKCDMCISGASIIRTSPNRTTAYPDSSSGGSAPPVPRVPRSPLRAAVFAHLSNTDY
ncbi:hypothetical protein EVAR_16835_1 [Eumeta japonica]|uniref:Uncharacterized protein n=1 Tax=Eumeta variegata TaxID=151549 RepID=A0A4C1V1L3_EUMVA|nr:hypothetical protein EVAR_16835_1 [Eumeta japonica]